MDLKERELILKGEVHQIVDATMDVSNQLGCGFLEAVYQEALGIELGERGIPYVTQKRIQISYKRKGAEQGVHRGLFVLRPDCRRDQSHQSDHSDRRGANAQLLEGNQSSAWVDRQFRRASTRMEALCQYEEESLTLMDTNQETRRMHSRLFACIRG